jgi:hypothetical protein
VLQVLKEHNEQLEKRTRIRSNGEVSAILVVRIYCKEIVAWAPK